MGATKTTDASFDDSAAQKHWETVRGDSSMTYAQVSPAIRDAYDRKRQVTTTTTSA